MTIPSLRVSMYLKTRCKSNLLTRQISCFAEVATASERQVSQLAAMNQLKSKSEVPTCALPSESANSMENKETRADE